jgi:hypothetical protein
MQVSLYGTESEVSKFRELISRGCKDGFLSVVDESLVYRKENPKQNIPLTRLIIWVEL